ELLGLEPRAQGQLVRRRDHLAAERRHPPHGRDQEAAGRRHARRRGLHRDPPGDVHGALVRPPRRRRRPRELLPLARRRHPLARRVRGRMSTNESPAAKVIEGAGRVGLDAIDPEIASLIQTENKLEAEKLRLIASENYVSRAVLEACGSVLTNKYSEG